MVEQCSTEIRDTASSARAIAADTRNDVKMSSKPVTMATKSRRRRSSAIIAFPKIHEVQKRPETPIRVKAGNPARSIRLEELQRRFAANGLADRQRREVGVTDQRRIQQLVI